MEQGPNEAKIIAQAKKMKMPLPERIKNKPKILVGLEFYWRAFDDLSGDRDVGMGVGPIPWRAIHDWALRNRVWGDDFERLVMVIRGLDAVFMEKQGAKNKKKMGKGKGSFTKPKAIGVK